MKVKKGNNSLKKVKLNCDNDMRILKCSSCVYKNFVTDRRTGQETIGWKI